MVHKDCNENVNKGDSDGSSEPSVVRPINRPPKPPGRAMGPYYQFLTTDLEKMQWIGSVLIFRHISSARPKVEFISAVKIDYDWEILYENVFDMCAYRINLRIEIPGGEGDEKILWKIDWDEFLSDGFFYIARYNQKWRGGFFSCNGYDASISKEEALDLNYDNVWNHLYSSHERSPLHLLVWGGDQSYNDFVLEDVPFLRDWTQMPWDQRWTYEFDESSRNAAEQYYFNTYAENWESRPEMKRALASIPGLMMWDDHDIFDGAGSYPPLLQQSPIMQGLFDMAQKMRLLFQHHTTPEKARGHGLFGYQGHNFISRCGPNLIILGTDGRTERNATTVQHEKTWDIIFDRLEKDVRDAKHLIVLFPVPFSFVRFGIVESFLECFKNMALKWNRIRTIELTFQRWKKLTMEKLKIPVVEQINSVFGLPEMYDDLLDEWTHDDHLKERNTVLQRFQNLVQTSKVRVTFFSGDVHCCGVSRFRTRISSRPSPIEDPKLMYQIISSAIVNKPPPKKFIQAAHLLRTKWDPIDNTEEQLIDFFEGEPGWGNKLFLKKLLPNRNWCYWEQCAEPTNTVTCFVDKGFLQSLWFRILLLLSFLGLDRFFGSTNGNSGNREMHEIASQPVYHQNIETDQEEREANNLKVRFWLESIEKHDEEAKFSSYDLLIPNLK